MSFIYIRLVVFIANFKWFNKNDHEFHAPLFQTNSYKCNIVEQQQGTIKMAIVKTGVLSFCCVFLNGGFICYVLVIVKKTINFDCVNLLQYLFCAAKKYFHLFQISPITMYFFNWYQWMAILIIDVACSLCIIVRLIVYVLTIYWAILR